MARPRPPPSPEDLPPGFDESKACPAIVSVHPIGSCKEQTAGNVYGTALADEGFVVIAFDASFQGASGGEPRSIEDPVFRSQDVSCAIDHLVTLPYADADRIGVIGVCGGGGYSIKQSPGPPACVSEPAVLTARGADAASHSAGVSVGRGDHAARRWRRCYRRAEPVRFGMAGCKAGR